MSGLTLGEAARRLRLALADTERLYNADAPPDALEACRLAYLRARVETIAADLAAAALPDQFAQHERNERTELSALTAAFGPKWVIARRTPRIVERYGAAVRCVSKHEYERVLAAHHEQNGCPPQCPARRRGLVYRADHDPNAHPTVRDLARRLLT